MKKTRTYDFSFKCYFGGGYDNFTMHRQTLKLQDLPKWLEAYAYTHPDVKSITVKWWPGDEDDSDR